MKWILQHKPILMVKQRLWCYHDTIMMIIYQLRIYILTIFTIVMYLIIIIPLIIYYDRYSFYIMNITCTSSITNVITTTRQEIDNLLLNTKKWKRRQSQIDCKTCFNIKWIDIEMLWNNNK